MVVMDNNPVAAAVAVALSLLVAAVFKQVYQEKAEKVVMVS
jgi:hypothetical protein